MPAIIIGYSRATFDPEEDLINQEDLWCISLQTGDKFTRRKWKQYYEIDLENQAEPPKFGLFEEGSVIGVLLDTDRGAVTFYKDGNDLGLAFLADDLKEGEFLPFVRTQCQCRLSLFSPAQYPWVADVPVEPAPPAEPTRDEEFLYSEMEEQFMKDNDELEQYMGMTDDETLEALFKDSLEYIDSDEERRLDAIVDEEHAQLYDMRQSNRFHLDQTTANVMPPRESVAQRASLKVRHRDLGLGHTRQVVKALRKANDTQIYALKDLE